MKIYILRTLLFMRKLKNSSVIFIILILSSFISLSSQTLYRFNTTISQGYMDDWRMGKKLSGEAGSMVELNTKFKIDTLNIQFIGRTSIGYLLEDSDQRQNAISVPTMNELFLETTLRLPIGWVVDPYFTSTNSTQIVKAYRYNKDVKTATATFRDPAITVQTLGMMHSYKINNFDYISSKIGLSLRQVRAEKFRQQSDDYTTFGVEENYKAESGVTINNESFFKIDSSLTYRTRLDLFGTFKKPDKWIFKWQNEIQIQLVKVIGLLIKFDLVYDEAQALRLQYIQSTRFGIIADIN